MKLLFILGDNAPLCKAELENYFSARGMKFEILDEISDGVIAEIDELKREIIKDLGGTIKICEVLDENQSMEKLKHPKISGLFSVSTYGFENNKKIQKTFAMKMKRASAENSRRRSATSPVYAKSKFFQGRSPQISAVEILKKNLLEKDFVILQTKNKIYLAKTIAVYNPFDFKKRDTSRPFQRPLYSMPIRLTKILLNLAHVTEKSKVLDPFCGFGLIPQEACSLSAEAFGSDVDDMAIKAAEGNLNWFQSEYRVKCKFNLSTMNVYDIEKVFGSEFFDAIVTEPYLGPPLRKPTEDEAFGIIEELEEFYSKALVPISAVLKKGRRLAIVFPKIKAGKRKFFEMNLKHILPENLKIVHGFEDGAEKQITIRKIYVFEKV